MTDAKVALTTRLLEHFRSKDTAAAGPAGTGGSMSDAQGLFVIGAARSGTTVLQNALNASRDVFLFGEPTFHEDAGRADFAARYNGMHRGWGNQENKSSFCPPLFDGDATWQDYLRQLAGFHRYVGSKIVVNPERAEATCERLFAFHCRHFYRAHYVFTFRNPIDVLMSTRGLAELNGDAAATHRSVLHSYLRVMALYIRMLRNLPAVSAVFHDRIDAATFASLGAWLGVDLSVGADYYDQTRVRRYTLEQIPEHAHALTSDVSGLYERLREQAMQGFQRVQLEQNGKHWEPSHFTPLGALHKDIERLLAPA